MTYKVNILKEVKRDRVFGKKLIISWLIIGIILSILFIAMSKKTHKAQAEIGLDFSTCPLYGMEDLDLAERKLKWTQKVLKRERELKPTLSNKTENKQIMNSNILALVKPIAQKYHQDFHVSEKVMTTRLIGLLKNENGLNPRFYPSKSNEKYLVWGDHNNACHAWQIDKRWHKLQCRPMTFAKSADYAIGKVLLKCHKKAKKRFNSERELWIATYACYNSGQFNDKYTTNNYGRRAYTA